VKQTHQLRAGYGIWELAAETEDVIRILQDEGLDLSCVVFYLRQVYQATEDTGPDAQTRRLYQVFWRPAGGSRVAPELERRLQELMPSRPAEARTQDPEAEWNAIYEYILMRLAKGVPS